MLCNKISLNFILDQYVKEGVKELDDKNLSELLKLKYKEIADAKQELGEIKTIRDNFINFQGVCIKRMLLSY